MSIFGVCRCFLVFFLSFFLSYRFSMESNFSEQTETGGGGVVGDPHGSSPHGFVFGLGMVSVGRDSRSV